MIRTFSEDIQGTTEEKEMVTQECTYKDHTHKAEPNARKWVITSEMVKSLQERKLPDDAVHSHLLIATSTIFNAQQVQIRTSPELIRWFRT